MWAQGLGAREGTPELPLLQAAFLPSPGSPASSPVASRLPAPRARTEQRGHDHQRAFAVRQAGQRQRSQLHVTQEVHLEAVVTASHRFADKLLPGRGGDWRRWEGPRRGRTWGGN